LVRLSCQCFTIPEATSCAVMGFMREKQGALFPREAAGTLTLA